jgi:titin
MSIDNFFSLIQISVDPKSNTVGCTVAGVRNVISGNNDWGVVIFSSGTDANVVQGNYIGPSAGGSFAIPNGFDGVQVSGGAKSNIVGGVTPGAGNVISGNSSYGLAIGETNTDNTVVQGNLIGVNINGTVAMYNTFAGIVVYGDAHFTQIGGTTPGARNIISGNLSQGIIISDPGTSATLVQGNFIGVDITGSVAIPNGFSGVQISGGCQSNTIGGAIGARNIISGNSNYGVYIANTNTDANIVQGNTIGLDVTSTNDSAYHVAGVIIVHAARSNQIGGTTLGSANLIASNASDGVQVFDAGSTNNSIRGNSIFGNAGIGIGLYNNSNKSRPAPSLSSAVLGTNLTVGGMLTSSSNATFRIEFFANPPGTVQGKNFLGAINATTGGGGTVTFSAGLASTVPVGQLITTTATDPSGNTSPFSAAQAVTTTDSVGDGIPDAWRAAFFGGSGTTTNNRSCAACDPDHDGLTNLQEFHAGTNPTNSASVIRITSVQPSGADVVVSFPSVLGKLYRVEMKDDITLATWTLLADQIAGTGSVIPITDPGAAALPKRFYRADVLP